MKTKNVIINKNDTKLNIFKKGNKKLILCHGVFDIVHIGHVYHFKKAKSFGDILIVSITSTKFVNKGPFRPIFTDEKRAEMLLSLDIVDYVIINHDYDAVKLIKKLKPNFYCKGLDYIKKNNDITKKIYLEDKAVKDTGGEIIYTETSKYSSSNLINYYNINLNKNQSKFINDLKKNFNLNLIDTYLKNLSSLKVMIIGETIIDEYVLCNTLGKAGKDPILTLKELNTSKYAGGVVSIANHISDFTKSIDIYSVIGDKNSNLSFIKKSIKKNVNFNYIIKPNASTIIKKRFIDNEKKSKIIGVYDINDNDLAKKEQNLLNKKIDKKLKSYDLVIVADYGHGFINKNTIKLLSKKSKFLCVNTQLNSANIGYHTISKYSKADFVCMHEGELRHDVRSKKDNINTLISNLQKKLKSKSVTVTRGGDGAIFYSKKTGFKDCPAFANNVIDKIGAGDTLFAIMSIFMTIKANPNFSLFIGNIAGGDAVSNIGNSKSISKIDIIKAAKSMLL